MGLTRSARGLLVALVASTSACGLFGSSPDDAPATTEADAGPDVLTGVAQPGNLAVAPPAGATYVVQGSHASLTVRVERKAGLAGPVTVTAHDLPEGITASSLMIGADAASGTLELDVRSSVRQGPLTATVIAELTPGGPEPTPISANAPLPLFVRGPAGALDTTYGQGGSADPLPANIAPTGLVALADERVIVLGGKTDDFRRATTLRLSATGALDLTYGDNGVATLAGCSDPNAAVIDADGRVILVGGDSSYKNAWIGRLLPTGQADGTFAATGVTPGHTFLLPPSAGHVEGAWDVAVTGAGTMLASISWHYDASTTLDTVASLDGVGEGTSTFGGAGYGNGFSESGVGIGIAARANGNVVGATALASGGLGVYELGATDGLLVSSFGEGGRKAFPMAGVTYSTTPGILLLADGRIVAPFSDGSSVRLARISADGASFDATFGEGGLTSAIAGVAPVDLALEPDGTILVVVEKSDSSSELVRFTEAGALDSSFGDAGHLASAGTRIALQKDGRILVLGETVRRFWD